MFGKKKKKNGENKNNENKRPIIYTITSQVEMTPEQYEEYVRSGGIHFAGTDHLPEGAIIHPTDNITHFVKRK